MDTIALNDLDTQVDHLLATIERLRIENKSLHIQLAAANRNRGQLIDSKKKAASQVKQIIQQLKEELE